jgi:copper chaperone NosL
MKRPHLQPSLVLLLFGLALLLLVACGSETDFDRPPDIVYGEDVCERCSMIINEARYAAAYVTEDGQAHLFDDIGGMVAHDAAVAGDVAVFWVHDFETEEWLRAEEAHYVKSDLMTPMGFGVIAFDGRDRAESWAAEQGGMVMTFDELLNTDQARDH